MATIVTRETTQTDGTSPKGSPLTNAEVDTNFINLNDDKVEVSGAIIFQAKAGEALAKGDVVYVSGVSGNEPIVSKADADDASKMPAYGLAEDAANLNAAVNVVTFGTLYDLNTSGFSAGDTVYVSTTAGALTNSAPTGESSLIQNIGMVVRSHASAGSIKVGGAGRTNATPNLNDGNVFIGNASNQAVARALTGDDISGGTITSFASTGIDDNATSTAITIDASENVNIGAVGTTTLTTLTGPFNGDVVKMDGSSGVSDRHLIFSNSSNSQKWNIDAEGGASSLGVLSFSTNSTERMLIDRLGNVGIGTTSPDKRLDVLSGTANSDVAAFSGTSTGRGLVISTFDDTGTNADAMVDFDAISGNGQLSFSTGTTERMRISSAGNVGIGTASPADTLGYGRALDIQSNSGASVYLRDSDNTAEYTALGYEGGSAKAFSIYNKAAGDVRIYTSGSQRATVDSSGNVGIGTASPNTHGWAKAVTLGTATNGAFELTQGSTKYGAFALQGDGRVQVVNWQAAPLDFYTSGTERMRIDSSGRVGIGTSSPDGKLNVFSASAGSVSADADADELVLENSGNVGLSLLTASTGESGIYFGNPGTNGQKDFYLKYYHESHATTANRRAFTFNTGSAERMRIDSAGNVGIGTASPSSDSIVKFLHINDATSSGLVLQGAKKFSVYSSSSSSLIFRDETAGTNRITLDTSGNVGIGTASPDAPLHIQTASGSKSEINLAQTAVTNYRISIPASTDALTFVYGASTERMRIDSSGRVFIGKTSDNDNTAGHTLHSSGLVVHTRDQSFTTIFNRTTSDGDIAQFKKDGALVGSIGSNNSAGTPVLDISANSTSGIMRMLTSGSERMRIDSAGRVGIGTTNLVEKLQVAASAGNGAGVEFAGNGNTVGSTSFFVGQGSGSEAYVYQRANSHMVFATSNTERMRIDSSGNLLVGRTSTPSGIQAGSLCINFDIHHQDAAGNDRLLYDRSANLLGNTGTNGAFYAIGVGTTSPNYALDVVGAIRATNSGGSTIIANRTSNSGSVELQYNGTQTAQFSALSGGGVATYVGSTPSEAMRIDSSGNLLVGATSASAKLQVDHSSASTPTALFLNQSTASSGVGAVQTSIPSQSNNTNCYHFKGTTQGVASYFLYGNGTSSFTSDERQKKNIVNTRDGYLDDLKRLRVVDYHWNNQEDTEDKSVGLIAQEVEQVFPHLVIEHEMEGVGLRKNLRGSEFTFVLIKAIQEQQAMIETLQAQVAELQGA